MEPSSGDTFRPRAWTRRCYASWGCSLTPSTPRPSATTRSRTASTAAPCCARTTSACIPLGAWRGATIYAINKAQVTSESIGIIYVLDMEGLEPLPDIDAVLQSEMQDYLFRELFEDDEVREAFESGDAEELGDAIYEFAETCLGCGKSPDRVHLDE